MATRVVHTIANDVNPELISFSKRPSRANLRDLGLYPLVFQYLRELWRDKLRLVLDTSFAEDGTPLMPHNAEAYPYVMVAGVRYGASTTWQGRGTHYAYIKGRVAVDILHIMKIYVLTLDGRKCSANIAIVRRFQPTALGPQMPWATR